MNAGFRERAHLGTLGGFPNKPVRYPPRPENHYIINALKARAERAHPGSNYITLWLFYFSAEC